MYLLTRWWNRRCLSSFSHFRIFSKPYRYLVAFNVASVVAVGSFAVRSCDPVNVIGEEASSSEGLIAPRIFVMIEETRDAFESHSR